jgi:NDP-sugar pyrophosphorylase family protein
MRAVILAGGKGKRLAPYTTVFPKPLMPIGDMPILEVVLRQLKHHGCDDVTLAVGHLPELLMAFFGDGSKWGMTVRYSREEQPLGTAGPLALISGLHETFLVMNGDVLCDINYSELVAYHKRQGAMATVASYVRTVHIDFGVLETDAEQFITEYREKPSLTYQVSMGIYVFEPEVLRYIEPGRYFDFPDLVKLLIGKGHKVAAYPFSGYWLDIGRPDDYERAVNEFEQQKHLFLPGEQV